MLISLGLSLRIRIRLLLNITTVTHTHLVVYGFLYLALRSAHSTFGLDQRLRFEERKLTFLILSNGEI